MIHHHNDEPGPAIEDHSIYISKEPTTCSSLLKDNFIMLNNHPCQLIESPMVHLVAKNLITGEKIHVEYPLTRCLDVPIVSTEYYQILSVTETGFLQLKLYDGDEDSIRDDIELPKNELGLQLLNEFNTEDREVYCTVVNTCGTERVLSINSFPTFPDFERLPFEMKEEIFSYLKKADLLSVRQVCRNWNQVVPITSLTQIHSIKICKKRITLKVVPCGSSNSNKLLGFRTIRVFNLREVPYDLLQTPRDLILRERVNSDDLNLIVNHCTRLTTIDLDYPTDETMGMLETLIENNSESLQVFSLWDYFWYNSEMEAFDCTLLTGCRSLNLLTLFVQHIKNIDMIPQCVSILKLDAVSIQQIKWISENLKCLKILRFELEHSHWGAKPDRNLCTELSDVVLKSLCNLPKMERLDLNLTIKEKQYTGFHVLCPEVFQFQQVCNSVDGIIAESDTWGRCCTLEIFIDQSIFKGFF